MDVRALCTALNIRPTKTLGQNFVHDGGTVRKIVREAGVGPGDKVLEIGPGLGSLTLALLESGAYVSAVEIDAALAAALPDTVARRHSAPENFALLHADALSLTGPEQLACPPALRTGQTEAAATVTASTGAPGSTQSFAPTALVANLPYNVAVPVLLTLMEALPSLETITVMVQLEVADRLAAAPGSRTYGVPSVKAAWYGSATRGAKISRHVFYPEPNVDSALVHLRLRPAPGTDELRERVFTVVDAAFAQRRKTLRSALGSWAGSPAAAETILQRAGVSPQARGETLAIDDFVRIAQARELPN
ncbi:16S rRNA (adenine(1518)-N(6)/adenine(1519)-N(6))-dimethyltransferase RsmA [Actinotignum schaalii]|nr:16S rRNA (adenine(1518)-N(6)/adenine(1519)-N(6))-dimethyltransferase RsmA [Actinotignum schaalii]WQN45991.1 16S rRNA (adenine(1518)-N(6)/adenine(1519)-N(6))-dimethyltransferase RsmA [Actinotignum schaalii]